MRIALISDLHGKWLQLDGRMPEADVLVVAGDLTHAGKLPELMAFNQWLGKQPYAHRVVIAGNHDLGLQERTFEENQSVLSNGIYLEDSGVEIDGLKLWGSPWTPTFGYGWAFMREDEDLRHYWDRIPEGLDLLVTHGPPFGRQDLTLRGPGAGSHTLGHAVYRANPKVHVFGHIHEDYGVDDSLLKHGRTVFINASTSSYTHQLTNAPIVIEMG